MVQRARDVEAAGAQGAARWVIPVIVSVVFAVFLQAVGFAFWLGRLSARVDFQDQKIAEMQNRNGELLAYTIALRFVMERRGIETPEPPAILIGKSKGN